ncbi:MAG TPA: ISNCY family transposase [Candidatus Acidoferrum sp.]|nr:ISNCY family transposase [Candidatus Acidoferrum sp.]
MSERELKRAAVLSRVAEAGWSLVRAAERMAVSYRQAKRLWKRYQAQGAKGLVHGNAGRTSNRAKPKRLRRRVLALLRKKYGGGVGERFGPTLAAEHLAEEDGIELGVETLRGWMLAEGLWSRDRRRRVHRQRRERKARFGELVQLDGSFHAWLEGRGPGGCLMNMVDDATGTTLCRLGKEETIWAAVGVLRDWIGCYGVPKALYTDWKNVYVREPNAGERMRGEEPVTQFGRMCQALGIEIWAASSPQAKGRVERNHGTHQDRLVKKLRRKRIGTHADANRYLAEAYCPQHNARYAQPAAAPEDDHLPSPGARKLAKIFRLETARVLSHDWVVQHDNRCYQVERQSQHHAPAKGKVRVCEEEDGSLEILYREQKLKWKEIAARPASEKPGKETPARAVPPTVLRPKWKPGPEHPWRRGYPKRNPAAPVSPPCGVPASSWASASAPP